MNEDLRKKYELAEADYMAGMTYKEIADKYQVSINTVKSWKTREKWSRKGKKSVHTKQKKVCTQKPEVCIPQKEGYETLETGAVESVAENTELTEKQRLFCLYFIRCFNATTAYQKAYGVDRNTAAALGSRMLRNDKVKNELEILKKERYTREYLSEADIFQKYMEIAFADLTDYVEFGTEEVPVIGMHGPIVIKDEKTGKKKPLMQRVNVVRFKDSREVDGTILSEVKEGKNGVSIKLNDRMKALQWLSDHMDLGTEEQKAKVKLLKMQTDRLSKEDTDQEDGVVIINDAPKEDGEDI